MSKNNALGAIVSILLLSLGVPGIAVEVGADPHCGSSAGDRQLPDNGQDFKLPSLVEVEQHSKDHQHLPGIPSEKEIADKGVSVGEMQQMQMAKSEEWTLYPVTERKAREKAEVMNANLVARLNALEQKLETKRFVGLIRRLKCC